MRILSWTKLSWWQKPRRAMLCTVAAGAGIAVIIALLIALLRSSSSLSLLSWTTFTGFPLLVVVAIASLARLQHHINIRTPQSREEPVSHNPQRGLQ